ncbi:hypothetical protein BO78DRAFT_70208 [Aspergillus sclerotiicarbonarius CBS 121057]|uniref:Uncharacterized protein n=1 Tax=Aspergillus sclerotiicarbonarius (strain CBS 121057 / IBT 28362) TaxID=1448318 RepID=A0A319EPF4_ASPSB|nr:hypothetical protein BO78DRAFT_70208 [Aspergillus sclerotiicarbonarius CBS 121057]
MAEYKYTGEQADVQGPELIGCVTQLLRDNQIPCILIGDFMWSLFHLPPTDYSIDFVIPDELMEKANRVLINAKFCGHQPLSTRDKCKALKPWTAKQFRVGFVPCYEFHLTDGQQTGHYDLRLYRQSESFKDLPEFPLESPTESDPDFMVVTDPRLPIPADQNDRWNDSNSLGPRATLPPIIIASPRALAGALIHVATRDCPLGSPQKGWRGWVALLGTLRALLGSSNFEC